MKSNEIWKPIPNFEKLYEVSNLGRVKALKRKKNCNRGWGWIKEHIMKNSTNGGEYYKVPLTNKDHIKKYYLVHRLVAITFIENKDNKPEVNHIDGNKLNNKVENLEWCTKEYNTKMAWEDGLVKIPKGEKNKMYGRYGKNANKSKPIYQFDLNGSFIKKWDSQKDVERELGFRQNCISNCALGRSKSSYGYIWRLNYE